MNTLKLILMIITVLVSAPFFILGILIGLIWVSTTAGIQTFRDYLKNPGVRS